MNEEYYFVGQIAFKKITRQSIILGLDLINMFDAKVENKKDTEIVISEMYALQELNNQKAHILAVTGSQRENMLYSLRNKGKRKNNGMIKVGKYPAHIHCRMNMQDYNDQYGGSLDTLYDVDVGSFAFVCCVHEEKYRYRVTAIRLVSDEEKVRDLIQNEREGWHFITNRKESMDRLIFEWDTLLSNRTYKILLRSCLFNESHANEEESQEDGGINIETSSGSNI